MERENMSGRPIPQQWSLLKRLLHPFKWRAVNRENKITIAELEKAIRRVGIEMMNRNERGEFRSMMPLEFMRLYKERMQKEMFEVLAGHGVEMPSKNVHDIRDYLDGRK